MSDTSDKRGKPAGGAFRAKGPRRDFNRGERDGDGGERPSGGKPRFDKPREGGDRPGGGGRPFDGKPRFDRDRDGGDRASGGGRPFGGKPRFNKDRDGGDRASGGGRPFGGKPRFDRDREMGERPAGAGRPHGGKPRFDRAREGGERSGGGGRPFSGKPRFDRAREGGERSGGGGRPFSGKPRFDRDREGGERSGGSGGRSFGGKPRFDRDREGPAGEGREAGKRPFSGKPRFDRDRERGKPFDRGGDRGGARSERRDHKPYEKKPRFDADRPRRGRDGSPSQDGAQADRGHSDDRLVRVSGLPSVAELFRSAPERVERLYFTKEMHPDVNAFCSKLAEQRKVYREVEPDELRKVAGTAMHGGVVALAEPKPVHDLNEEAATAWAAAGEMIIVLDGVGNPQNIGAIARTASFLGIKRLLVSNHPSQAGLSNAAYRIAKGGLEGIEVYRVSDLPATLRQLKSHFHVIGTALGQGVALEALPMAPKPVAVVLGNEEEGLGDATLAACHSVVSIPGGGTVQSLNVSAAAAILIYALQRRSKPKV